MFERVAVPGAPRDEYGMPTTPGAIIGYTSRGPIRLLAGGAPDGNDADEGDGDEGSTDAPDENDDQGDDAGGTGDDGQDDDEDRKTYDSAYVKRLRKEASKHRVKASEAARQVEQQQAALKQALKVLGIGDGDENPTPDQLAEQLEQAQAQVWTTAVEHTVERAARSLGVDGEKLLDSRRFIDSLDEFVDEDPRTPEFRDRLAEHIKQYTQDNKGFGAQVAAKSGGDFSGGPGNGPDPSKMPMSDYIKWRSKRDKE